MSGRVKRKHDSEDEEDFVGFDNSDGGELQDSGLNNKRVRKLQANQSLDDSSIVYDMQSEEEFIALYQNWDKVDKSVFPDPGPLGDPFKFGWKRELVFRATTGVSKEKGDVYYITPNGRKLRTRNEIQLHLGNGLTMDNFSLSKVPLYLGPEFEIVRSAKMKATVKIPSPREISPLLGKRIPKPKAPKGASPPHTPSSGNVTPIARPKPKQNTPLAMVNKSGLSMGSPSPLVTQKKSVMPIIQQAPQAKMEPCTIQCRLAQGIPQLQCISCLCLYHKECVRERRGASYIIQSDSYVCDGCCPPTTNARPESNAGQEPPAQSGRQSVVTIKGQRFIVVPKSTKAAPPNNTGRGDDVGSATIKIVKSAGTPSKMVMQRSQNGSAKLSAGYSRNAAPQATSANFFRTTAMGYDVLLNVFQCLTVKELLRASRVCRLFNYTAHHPLLWRTVRMKNSPVKDWAGFARALRTNGTRHLDMRKMLMGAGANRVESQWEQFLQHVATVEQLQGLDLCGRCPPNVLEALFTHARQLRVLNGQSLRDTPDGLSFADIEYLTELEELRLRPENWMSIRGELDPVGGLTNLRHLSLTMFLGLNEEERHVTCLANLTNLESLELGECTLMITELSEVILPQLQQLRRLRLEKGVAENSLMLQIASMPALEQLELVNFDVKAEFNDTLAQCTNIRRLMIIPTYVAQSATTNHLIMSGLLGLGATLQVFTWVVTQELLRVTELYRNQDETIELIPVIKPVPGDEIEEERTGAAPEVEMVPLTHVQEILQTHLPETFITILKDHLQHTWRLNIVDS